MLTEFRIGISSTISLYRCLSSITDKDLHVMFECLTQFCLFTDGSPDGFCSDSVLCKDANSVCSSGICQCTIGFRNIDSECREGNGFRAKIIFYQRIV